MAKKSEESRLQKLPVCAIEFIKLVIKKMRYRKKVRADVQAELAGHFKDKLRDCKTDKEREQKAQQLIENFGDAKLLGILLRRAKKRCRPFWRIVVARTFQTVGVLILCLIVYLVWFFSGRPVVTVDYVAELNRIVRPTADESLNAALLYNKAAELYKEKSSDEISKLLGTKYNEATNEQKQLIEKWLESNNEALELVIAGSKKPYYWQKYETGEENTSEVMAVFLPHLRKFRSLVKALYWRAWLKVEQGRYEDAFNDLKACYRFGQHLKGDKFLVEQLVGIGIEASAVQTIRDIISEYRMESALLAELQNGLQQTTASEDFVISLKGEKLGIYDEIQRCFTKDRFGGGHLYIQRLMDLGGYIDSGDVGSERLDNVVFEVLMSPDRWVGAARVLFTHPNKQQTKKTVDRLYDYWETITDKSPAQVRTEGIDFEKETLEIIKGNILLEILTPTIGRVIENSYRVKADVESTLTIIAILRYKQDTGDYPESLDDLIIAGYLKHLPIDPWSDKPLVYGITDDGFILYSVGCNFEDDGGQVYRDEEGNVHLWHFEFGDAVFWPVQK